MAILSPDDTPPEIRPSQATVALRRKRLGFRQAQDDTGGYTSSTANAVPLLAAARSHSRSDITP